MGTGILNAKFMRVPYLQSLNSITTHFICSDKVEF